MSKYNNSDLRLKKKFLSKEHNAFYKGKKLPLSVMFPFGNTKLTFDGNNFGTAPVNHQLKFLSPDHPYIEIPKGINTFIFDVNANDIINPYRVTSIYTEVEGSPAMIKAGIRFTTRHNGFIIEKGDKKLYLDRYNPAGAFEESENAKIYSDYSEKTGNAAHVYAIVNNQYKDLIGSSTQRRYSGLINTDTNEKITNPYHLLHSFMNYGSQDVLIRRTHFFKDFDALRNLRPDDSVKASDVFEVATKYFSDLKKNGAKTKDVKELELDFYQNLVKNYDHFDDKDAQQSYVDKYEKAVDSLKTSYEYATKYKDFDGSFEEFMERKENLPSWYNQKVDLKFANLRKELIADMRIQLSKVQEKNQEKTVVQTANKTNTIKRTPQANNNSMNINEPELTR